jgi:regulatory protein YycI of two-component signal transduction system YycFG
MEILIVILLVINIFLNFKTNKTMSKAEELLNKLDVLLSEVQADEASEEQALAEKNEAIELLKAEVQATKDSAGLSSEEEAEVFGKIEEKIQKIQDEITPKKVTEQVVEEQTTENVDETGKPVEEVTEEQSNQ